MHWVELPSLLSWARISGIKCDWSIAGLPFNIVLQEIPQG